MFLRRFVFYTFIGPAIALLIVWFLAQFTRHSEVAREYGDKIGAWMLLYALALVVVLFVLGMIYPQKFK